MAIDSSIFKDGFDFSLNSDSYFQFSELSSKGCFDIFSDLYIPKSFSLDFPRELPLQFRSVFDIFVAMSLENKI